MPAVAPTVTPAVTPTASASKAIAAATPADLAIALAIDPPMRGLPCDRFATLIPDDWQARCAANAPPAGCNSHVIRADGTMTVSAAVVAGVADSKLTSSLGLDPTKVAALAAKLAAGTPVTST